MMRRRSEGLTMRLAEEAINEMGCNYCREEKQLIEFMLDPDDIVNIRICRECLEKAIALIDNHKGNEMITEVTEFTIQDTLLPYVIDEELK